MLTETSPNSKREHHLSGLQVFGPEIWIADGPVVPFLPGFPYPTRMTLIRLSGGSLWVWSPVPLSPALKMEIDALGAVRHIVSPNLLHHLFLGQWKEAYPEARLYASPGLGRRRKDLTFDAEVGDSPDPAWAADIDQVAVRGSVAMTEVVFFHHVSRTAIFADLIESLPRDWLRGWRGLLARLDGITAENPGAPREWRLTFLRRRTARAAVKRILVWPVERVVIAHGDPVTSGGHAFVRRAFNWLLGPTSQRCRPP